MSVIRTPDRCLLRSTDGASAYCQLLIEMQQGLSKDDSRVSLSICESCCRTFQPTQFDLNPVIASLIWSNCDRALKIDHVRNDVELCRRLRRTQDHAEASLPVVLPDEDDLPNAPMLAHQFAATGSIDDLRRSLPIPDLAGRRIYSWAVGITTAHRRQPTVDRCLQSLRACGWQDLHIFVDGDVSLPESEVSDITTVRRPPAGAWRNFYLSLVELVRRYPAAEGLMLVQDDALWSSNFPVREYLQEIPWPNDGRFIISPYCCADYTADSPGWHQFKGPWHYGAVSLIFSRRSAEEFLSDPGVIERSRSEFAAGIDTVVGEWAARSNIAVFYPTPSLVQHIGDVSTLWATARAVGLRRATRFIGDEVRSSAENAERPRSIVCGWISDDPPIVYHSMGAEDPGRFMPDEPITRLAMYLWHQTSSDIAFQDRQARSLRPRHSIHHLVNDEKVCRELQAQGITAHFVNHNAFLDERLFSIELTAPKFYDAVYNARMAPFKRHELAAAIPNLLVIGGTVTPEDTDEYFRTVKARLAKAHFTYDSGRNFIPSGEVNLLLNKSRVGLCLSASEGAMYAATEYLLCGLPVVSTVSDGGRDSWFDPRFTRIVADHPDAVAAAVQNLISCSIPPDFIRAETLNRMWEHRRRLLDLGQTIYAAKNVGRDFARDFYENFRHKLGEWCSPTDIMRRRRTQQRHA